MHKLIIAAVSIATAVTVAVSAQPELDPTFNQTGISTTPIAGFGGGTCSAVQVDNKVIVAGHTNDGNFVLVRYAVNGTPDNSFGTGGMVVTEIVPGGMDIPNVVVIQSDGKILVGGVANLNSNDSYIALVRYNSDGSLDTSFGAGGRVMINIEIFSEDQIRALTVQPDGKIVVAGYMFPTFYRIIVLRFQSNGALDGTFGSGGKVITSMGGGAIATAVALQADGKIISAGRTRSVSGESGWDAYVNRYNSNGILDSSFDGDGSKIFTPSNNLDTFSAVAVQPNGKILVGGMANGGPESHFYLHRLNLDGTPDDEFDGDGQVDAAFGGDISSIVISPSGKINAVGTFQQNFAVARYLPNGLLDTGFSEDGKLTINVNSTGTARSAGYDSVGRLIIGGNIFTSLAAARLRAAQSVNVTGRVVAGGRPVTKAILFLSNGSGVVAAGRTNPFGHYRFRDVEPGAYTITVRTKGSSFEPRQINAIDDLADVDFVTP